LFSQPIPAASSYVFCSGRWTRHCCEK